MSDKSDPGTTSEQEAAQADTSAGNEDYSEIGSLNSGETEVRNDPLMEETRQQTQSVQEQQPEVKGETEDQSQPSPKDERHFSRKINELNDSRTNYAKRLIERDRDAIYDIADEDPKLAEKLLKEYDYDVETVDELLELKNNTETETVKEKTPDTKKVQRLEEELFKEKILRLKKTHEDLDEELIDEFKKVYSNPAFEEKTESQMLNIARASLERMSPTSKADETALEILRSQEGFSSPAKQSGDMKKRNIIPDSKKQMYRDSGVSESDMEKYLPPDIDDMVAYSHKNLGD